MVIKYVQMSSRARSVVCLLPKIIDASFETGMILLARVALSRYIRSASTERLRQVCRASLARSSLQWCPTRKSR